MIENIVTYKNKNGFPIIRRCNNCKFWNSGLEFKEENIGYCKAMPLYFAFTLQKTVYPITRDFYLCEQHEFEKEEKLKEVSESILLKDAIQTKDNIK